MRISKHWRTGLAAVLLLVGCSLLASAALAQGPQQTYDLSWWTVDGGGGSSSGGNYALDGTAGQPDPGPLLGGGRDPQRFAEARRFYTLEGGFWGGGVSGVTVFYLYLPPARRSLRRAGVEVS